MQLGFVQRTSRRLPLAMALACVLAVGFALFTQYVWDMRPCPWCVLQRLIFLVIAVLSVICALRAMAPPAPDVQRGDAHVRLRGILAAVYQHEVASKQFSCNLTFADTLVTALRLEALWPTMFKVTATCAEAAVSMLGVPFEYWSLGAVRAARHRRRRAGLAQRACAGRLIPPRSAAHVDRHTPEGAPPRGRLSGRGSSKGSPSCGRSSGCRRIRRRVLLDDLALVHEDHAVRHRLGEAHLVRHAEHRDALTRRARSSRRAPP